jgi:hypothetical protein
MCHVSISFVVPGETCRSRRAWGFLEDCVTEEWNTKLRSRKPCSASRIPHVYCTSIYQTWFRLSISACARLVIPEFTTRLERPSTSHPPPSTLHSPPSTLHPPPSTLHPPPYTFHPIIHPTPHTPHPTPYTPHPSHPAPYEHPIPHPQGCRTLRS